MKKTAIIGGIVLFSLLSCVKDNTPVILLNNTVDTTSAMQRHDGGFINGPYGSVSGTARIYKQDNQFILALQNVSISNGPDLHVYISKELMPVNFIDLGSLQSTIGYQLYPVPGNPDFNQFRYVLIHCKKYNHLFGSAALK